MKITHNLVFMMIAGLLTACGPTRFNADITEFHSFAPPEEASLTFEALDPEKSTSPEFVAYADQVGNRLAGFGFSPATDGNAQVVAYLDYSVTRLAEVDRSSGGRVGIGVGGGSRNVGIGTAISLPLSGGEEKIRYDRSMVLHLRRIDETTNFYEARISSVGMVGDMANVMPYMLDALFQDFPGESGANRTVRIEIPEGAGGDY